MHSLFFLVPSSLAGYPPFSDEIEGISLADQVKQGRYSFPQKYWGSVSSVGKLRCGIYRLSRANSFLFSASKPQVQNWLEILCNSMGNLS